MPWFYGGQKITDDDTAEFDCFDFLFFQKNTASMENLLTLLKTLCWHNNIPSSEFYFFLGSPHTS